MQGAVEREGHSIPVWLQLFLKTESLALNLSPQEISQMSRRSLPIHSLTMRDSKGRGLCGGRKQILIFIQSPLHCDMMWPCRWPRRIISWIIPITACFLSYPHPKLHLNVTYQILFLMPNNLFESQFGCLWVGAPWLLLTALLLHDAGPHPDHLTKQGHHNGKESQMHLGCWQAPVSAPGSGHL